MKITKESVAYHEAGHAVVAWLCDHDLEVTTIRPDPDKGTLGEIEHDEQGSNELFDPFELHPSEDAPYGFVVVLTGETSWRFLTGDEIDLLELRDRLSDRHATEQHVMIAAAGEATERRYAPETVKPEQSGRDWESVSEHLEHLAEKRGKSHREVRSDLTAETTSLLDDPLVWRMVEGVADALLAQETLTSTEVTRAIRAVVGQ